jgi:hypothetical protein
MAAAAVAAAGVAPQQQQQQHHWQQQRLLRLQQQRVWPERSQLEKSIMACPSLKALAGVVSDVGAVHQLFGGRGCKGDILALFL